MRTFKHMILFSLGLGQSQNPSFGPKMNTKVAFNTTTGNVLTSSRHSRKWKLGVQQNQTNLFAIVFSLDLGLMLALILGLKTKV